MPRWLFAFALLVASFGTATAQPATPAPDAPASSNAAPSVPAPGARSPANVGIDGHISHGLVATLGGSLRVDIPGHAARIRLGGLTGNVVEGESNGFEAAFLHIGLRTRGRVFGFAEGGATLRRQRAYVDIDDRSHPVDWDGYPSLSLGVGARLDLLEITLYGNLPYLGIFLGAGFDIASF